MKTPYHFFLRHAGYSYNPSTQTPLQGRIGGAKRLAHAEKAAMVAGCSFEWSIDPASSSLDFSDECPPWDQWQCVMRDCLGRIVQSLHGIDCGRGGGPWGDPYRRVVQAELAIEEGY